MPKATCLPFHGPPHLSFTKHPIHVSTPLSSPSSLVLLLLLLLLVSRSSSDSYSSLSKSLPPNMSTEGLAKRSRDPLEQSPKEDEYTKERKPASVQHKKGLRSLLVAVSLPLVAGIVNSFFNSPNQPFYREVKKPSWSPPNWLFVLVWSILYPVMGLASWLVWVEGGWRKQAYPLGVYVLQLVLNLAWSAIFFGMHNILLALIDICALVVVLAVCINAFRPVNHVASNLLKPYLVWVIFATALNYSLWMKNKGGEPLLPAEQLGEAGYISM